MSTVPSSPTPQRSVLRGIVGVVAVVAGLTYLGAGGWLGFLGGSWYYAIAGLALIASGSLLLSGNRAALGIYAALCAGTVLWTAWESGLNYWGWVPRLGFIVVLGVFVALTAPTLAPGPSRGVARGVAGLLVVVLLAAVGLAFVPYGFERPGTLPQARIDSLATDVGNAQVADAPPAGDWAAYGGSNTGTRYSSLTQINRDNVKQLTRAWEYRTGDLLEYRWGAETTPLKVGHSLYLCTSRNVVISVDAATGKERWRYDPKVPDEAIPYTAACRGVSYYEVPKAQQQAVAAPAGDAAAGTTPATPAAPVANVAQAGQCAARILAPTLDGRILALDAATGELCKGFGNNGQVDIKEGMGVTPAGYVSINSAPTIVRDVVVTGHQVLDGQRRDAPSGVIKGFDAMTGALRWAWDSGRPERSGPLAADETYTRGSPNMWTTAIGDSKLGLVYLPMGNAAADYWSGSRTPAEDKYGTSLVALDVTTGLPKWHFQVARKDVWDYDLGSQPTLIDFPAADGKKVPAILLPTKQGDIYVFNRETGESLFGIDNRPVPQGGAEPEQRSRTQPFSRYHTLQKPDLTERSMWGISAFDQMFCRIQYRQASYQGIYTPPEADRPNIQYTGYNGGSDWGSVAVDPVRGVIVANYNDMPNYNRLVPREEANRKGWKPREELDELKGGAEGAGDPQAGTPFAIDVNAGWRVPFTGMLCKEPPYGGIRAIDLVTGKTVWDRPLGTARKNGPFGIPSGLPIEIGTPNNGGSVVTAGGLVFIAAATDDLIRAIDLETGETVWQDVLPAGGQANPLVYEANGQQYLLIVAAGHHFMETPTGDYVIAYALPKKQ